MCNDVDAIRKTLKCAEIAPSELIFSASTNDPTFKEKLARAIFNDLRNVSRDCGYYDWEDVYKHRLNSWVELCKEQGWEFPEVIADKKTHKEFRDYFVR